MEFKLLIKKINGTLSKKEAIAFDAWYHESALHQQYYKSVKAQYLHDNTLHIDTEKAYSALEKRLHQPTTQKKKWHWAIAAAMIAAVAISTTLLWNRKEVMTPSHSPVVNQSIDIPYGTNKAILKKSDGTQIALQEGQDYEDNRVTSNGQSINYKKNNTNEKTTVYNTLEVPRGGIFTITLADGTVVWLNSDSAIKYPVSFANTSSREVELLYGEAYFNVSPSTTNNGKTFSVISQDQTIQVLGTEFNVKAYRGEENIATTLVEGKVALSTPLTKSELVPGKQAVYNLAANKVKVKSVNIYDEISWKDGLFSFKDKPLKEIMTVLTRWYDVDIKIENQQAAGTKFNGVFNKKQNLDQILLIIEKTNEAKFVTVGKTIILK